MATTSYGSITIVDITDIGQFSVYPKCSLPTTVIYSPDSGNYTPDWSTNNLQITPVVYYAGAQMTSGLLWEWKLQAGISGSETPLSTNNQNGININNTTGKLTVSKNWFAQQGNESYSQVTYKVKAKYPDNVSGLGRELVAEGQITFSKISQGTNAKTARINGNNIFKYNTDGALVGNNYITLTGSFSNCTFAGWKYYDASVTGEDKWKNYPIRNSAIETYPDSNGEPGATLNVYQDDSVFNNDTVRIKLTTNSNDVYDEFTIYKLRDGAAGTQIVSAILTNEDQMIPSNQDGTIPATGLNGAVTRLKIYDGGVEVNYNEWTIGITVDQGLTIRTSANGETPSWRDYNNSNTHETWVKVTNMTVDSGNVTFTASKGTTTLTKQFSLLKVKAGQDAAPLNIYDLVIDPVVLNLSSRTGGTFTPSSLTIFAKQTIVSTTGTPTNDFLGRFEIKEYYINSNDPTTVRQKSEGSAVSSISYSPSSANVTKTLVNLYDSAGSNILDSQTIIVVTDGATGAPGDPGAPGEAAVNVILGNEAQVFPCTSTNYPISAITVRIPFAGYKGTSRIEAIIPNRPTLLGISPDSETGYSKATVNEDGYVQYIIPTSTVISANSGTLSLTISCGGQFFNKIFKWTRSTAATNGVDGVTMLLYTPQGTLFDNGTGTLTVQGYLQSGSTDVSNNGTTWKWYQYLPNTATPPVYDYRELPQTTTTATASGKTLTVPASAIQGYGSFKVTATYNNKPYTQYISLTDKTDPIQVSIHSTLGTQIVNGQGAGALYVRVTRNGEEIDPIGNAEIPTGTSIPVNSYGVNGDHYIVLNSTNKTATLYQKNNGTWVTTPITSTYQWTFRDVDNKPITGQGLSDKFGNSYNSSTGKVTGKCIYIDKNTVDNKLTADVMVIV